MDRGVIRLLARDLLYILMISMPQLHFTVDEQTAKHIQREARRRGMSISQYVASLVRRGVGATWPQGYLERVIGSCAGGGLREPAELPVDDVEL